jgi:hypothetical protein
MVENYGTLSHAYRYRESLIGAVSAGFFLILLGALFVLTPGLFNRTIDFFESFGWVTVPNTAISWFAPTSPLSSANRIVYTGVEQFCFAFGVFHIVILALRFAARSSTSKKADTVGNLIFWIGAGYLVRTLLLETIRWTSDPMTVWFVFWAALITLVGVTLIVRAVILAAAIPRRIT